MLECNDVLAQLCVLRSEKKTPDTSQQLARGRQVHVCGAHHDALEGNILAVEATKRNLSIALFDCEQVYCRWVGFTLEETLLRFGSELFSLWHGIRNMFQLMMDGKQVRPSLLADFWNPYMEFWYSSRQLAPFQRRARGQLEYLVLSECVGVYSFEDFAQDFLYVLSSQQWAPIKVLM